MIDINSVHKIVYLDTIFQTSILSLAFVQYVSYAVLRLTFKAQSTRFLCLEFRTEYSSEKMRDALRKKFYLKIHWILYGVMNRTGNC